MNKKVIIVDDEVDLTKLAKMKLENAGYECLVLNNSQNAFETIKREAPCVVILDVMMPGITGYDLCRRIRKDPITYTIPILIFSALGQEPEILHGLEQGADDYLVKPFSPERLIERVESMMELGDVIERKNPTTNLPGTEAIKREINHRLLRGETFAVCYVDIMYFKPYRQHYKDKRHDDVTRDTATLIQNLIREQEIYESFLGHMGGEHFISIINIERYEKFCAKLTERFAKMTPDFYEQKEQDQGFIHGTDRTGQRRKFPFMCMSVGVVHNAYRKFKSAAKIFEVLAQVKHMAEKSGASCVFVDRRKSDR
ncbi:response regulator [Candidatus Hydrogenedentota bacterium]